MPARRGAQRLNLVRSIGKYCYGCGEISEELSSQTAGRREQLNLHYRSSVSPGTRIR
jgi:hypothetical protein